MKPIQQNSAVKYVLDILKKAGYKWENIINLNQLRYTVVKGYNKNPNVAIVLKRAWFMKFGEMFDGESGIGDTLNCEDIKIMIQNDVRDIYIVYEEKVYGISMLDFLTKSNVWKNKEGKDVRSISIHQYKRVF